MPSIWCISGPCGCGKTTLSAALTAQLSHQSCGRQVCLLHGDDFHASLRGDERSCAALPWEEVLRFNWDCLLSCAGHALARGLDVVLDYIVEDELPRLRALAAAHGASLYYAVLTAPEDVLRQRLQQRGDAHLTERALFLRRKLTSMEENQGHILDHSGPTEETLARLLSRRELLHCDIDNPAAHGVS